MNHLDPGYFVSTELRGFGFVSVGDNVSIARNTTVIGLERIRISCNVRIDGPTTIVVGDKGSLSIGSFVHIGGHCHVGCADSVTFADFSGLSQRVSIYSATDDYSGASLTNPMVPKKFKNVRSAPVSLGRHVIVGAGTIILPGVEIGDGCSIGALSLVHKSLEPWGVYAGSPARRLKARSKALLKLETVLLQQGLT